ncbi:testis-expressed protein 15 [Tupaia chinensis]|uniref:testis-expressed protein 15 n=1 Tax=Tupaia chinensis TaxID=246437 RepID=UPI000FFC0473|nr:testis-expressed protein 15 [Tupaia chinensis]
MANNKMEMKEIAKHKTVWKMNSTSDPSLITGLEVNPLKKFIIPKIRKTAEKVYLSPCCTNTREYSFIHDTLSQCRLDVSCDLRTSWQFGDTKLVHNEELEKNFTAKRSEMRESGRHGRELEEQFCFLALPQSDVVGIYQHGMSTGASALKTLGDPLLGVYLFRHVDVALNYAHSRNVTVESIVIFKVLFGKVKKMQPCMDKNKVSLDPSPNFDCHMSRTAPSLKDSIELQACSSAVYFYEYSVFLKPIDKPRQCLPYAIVTVKFVGQKVDNGHLMTSLRFLSAGFPIIFTERTCSLNNCTVAKRIGKGKDATVIFEHFRKPVDPFIQENCSCSGLNLEINPSNSNVSNSCGSQQNGSISMHETYSGTEHSPAGTRDTSQVLAQDSASSFTPSDTRERVSDGDLLFNLACLQNVLSGLSAAFPLQSNIGSSTVITSKLIKDPRLMRREENLGKQNNTAGLNEILPFEKSSSYINSEINLPSVPTNSAFSSEGDPGERAFLTNFLDTPCFKIPFGDSQFQTHSMSSKNYDHATPGRVNMEGQCKDQGSVSFPISLSDVVSDTENQNYSEAEVLKAQQRSNIPLLINQSTEPYHSDESVNSCTQECNSHILQGSQSSQETVHHPGDRMSTVFPQKKKESIIDKCIQNIGKMRNFTDPEDSSKCGEKQISWKEIESYFSSETRISSVDNYFPSYQQYAECESLDSSGEKGDKIAIAQELQIPKSSMYTREDEDELDHLSLELQNNITPSVECLSQKHPQHTLAYEDNIHKSFAIAHNLMELKLEEENQNCVSIMTNDFPEANAIPQAEELPMDTVISYHDIETALDNSNCSISREQIFVHRENENEPVSLENMQRDCKEAPPIEDEGQDQVLLCSAHLNNDEGLNVNFREGSNNDEGHQNESREQDSTSPSENSRENIYEDEKQGFYINKNVTSMDERRDDKNGNNVESLSSEKFSSTFNLTWGENYVSKETVLLESKSAVNSIRQKDTQVTGKSIDHFASTTSAKISGSSLCVASYATEHTASSTLLAVSTKLEDHQGSHFKGTCSSGITDSCLLEQHGVSDCEIDTEKNKLQDSFHQPTDEKVLQSLEPENEIEVQSKQCGDTVLFQEDTLSHGNAHYDDFGDIYEVLKARIDWEGLFGSSNVQAEISQSTTRRENSDRHCSKNNCFYSFTQKSKTERLTPILLPDLQITITNTVRPEGSFSADSLALKDNFRKDLTEATNPEINEKREDPEFYSYFQPSGENSGYPCEDKFGNTKQESGLVSKSALSLSFDLSPNTHVHLMSEKQKNESLFTQPSDVTTRNSRSRYFFTKSKADSNDSRSKKDRGPRISKRKLHTSYRNQNMSHKDLREHEICGGKKRVIPHDTSECFFSLSQGRIKTFSQSEKHIRSVLDILNSEASLCKSKRLSRKLDRAVLHLKKAHRRVHTSLQLIAKVGEKRKVPLPKSYAIVCNNFWESCDLQGYSTVSERKYYSTKHFWSKRNYDKQGERRAIGFDVGKSLTHVSKTESYETNGERVTKSLSRGSVASSVSKSHTTIHMREFYDQEQHAESQLLLPLTTQSTNQSTYKNSSVRNSRASEHQPLSTESRCLFSPGHTNEKLTEKGNQTDTEFLSNISKYEKSENRSAHNIEDTTKDNSEVNVVINESNSVFLSCKKGNRISYSTDKNHASYIPHTKVKMGILTSVLKSNMKHFLNVGIYKQDSLLLSGCKRNLEVSFPTEMWAVAIESSKPSIRIGNFFMDPLNLPLTASRKYSIPQLLPAAPVTDSEGESSKSYLRKPRIFAIGSFAACTTSHCQQRDGAEELPKVEQCPQSNCSQVDGKERNVAENSELDLMLVNENKSHGKNITKKLVSSDRSLLLKEKSSKDKYIAKKDIQNRKIWRVKEPDDAKDLVNKSMTEASTVKTGYKSQNKIIREELSHINEKTVKNNLSDSHLTIKNMSVDAGSSKNTVFKQLNKKKYRGVKVGGNSQPDSILCSEVASDSQPGEPDILGVLHFPVLHAHSKVTAIQKPTSHVNEFKAKKCSASCPALITKLSQILQRADEASSLQILQEETEVCRNILPLFVEAFERKQECSLEQILISRELLVEQNLWNNWKHKLKPCAVDTLVELQMMMETIQFIENKKRLLKGEPTFRSLLWFDKTLYGELLGRPRGYQQQSNFYPAFQGRLKYNAFCELQNYHDQLIELFEETKRENNSYYAFLKYKRQMDECEAIMRHCSDCFDFSLSVPFTCGVNFGDSLGDLEILRKSTLNLISAYRNAPKVQSCPGKQDHLWIIIEMISSKVNFIKSNEAVNIQVSLYGLEHIFFDAAKTLTWKERKQSFDKKYSGKKNKEMLLKMNQCAYAKLKKIYDTLSKELNNKPIPSIGLEEHMIASRKSDDVIKKSAISMENYRFNSTLLSHPDICCISEILEQAEYADFRKLQQLSLRCTDHLAILKKYFQMLQEDNIDNILITEENVLDMVKNRNHEAIILKPAAVETYIEIVMLSETVHFLKNSMAKKLDKQRFRGMLWFDLSLLPELIHCQEKMASFSCLKGNSTDCLWEVIDTAVSELKKDLDVIYKYNEAVNCLYAFHLFSRELEELSEIKKLLKKSQYSVSTYTGFVPYIASINYGSTVTELDYNYSQFSTLLKNIMASPRKDLGKMAHTMKIMKTIEHMKTVCANKNAELTVSFILCQMLYNRRKTLQLKRKEKVDIHVIKPGGNVNKSSISMKVPSISEYIIKNVTNSSKKRPITLDKCENSQEQEKNIAISSCKKQKVNVEDVTEMSREKAAFKPPRTTGSHLRSKNKVRSGSSYHLEKHVSPRGEIQRSPPGSLLPLTCLKDTCSSKSESKTDLTNISSDISEHCSGQPRNLNSTKKRNEHFGVAETKNNNKDCGPFVFYEQETVNGIFSEGHETSVQKLKSSSNTTQKFCLSNIKPGTNVSLAPNALVSSKPVFRFVQDSHTNLEMSQAVLELQDGKVLNSPIKNTTYTSSSEPIFSENKVPVLQIDKTQSPKMELEKNVKDALNPSPGRCGAGGDLTLGRNHTARCSLSEQQDDRNAEVLTLSAASDWSELPPSAHSPAYTSEHSFGAVYPSYTWCVYHYSSRGGSAVAQTYQGVTSYDMQPPPAGLLTAVASAVQDTHSTLLCSQYFTYFAGEPQANDFLPASGYFQAQMPSSYHFQQPFFSQYAFHQPFPQAACLYPPNPSVLPEFSWLYAPWHQEAFHPGH